MVLKMEKIYDYLRNCTDEDILFIENNIEEEIANRLIALLKKHNCTTVEISGDDSNFVTVMDMFGWYNFGEEVCSKYVNFKEIGYKRVFTEDDTPMEVIYVLDKNNVEYSGETIMTLWDAYRAVKEYFNED